ncbi:MAG: hypothetical protein V4446_06645 [Pseudomonadota bacterium]
MKSLYLWVIGIAMLGCISGCHQKQPPVPKTADNARLFDTQRDALQRAKAIEQTMQQQSEAEKQRIDQQGN